MCVKVSLSGVGGLDWNQSRLVEGGVVRVEETAGVTDEECIQKKG